MPTSLSKVVGVGGYRNYQLLTTSGTFTVPANVYKLKLGAQGAGASGMGNGWSSGGGASEDPLMSGSGGGAGTYIAVEIDVQPNDEITYVIGQGGIGAVGTGAVGTLVTGNSGGNTWVRINGKPIVMAEGAPFVLQPGSSWNGGGHACISRIYEVVRGGSGSNGNAAGSLSGANGAAGLPPSLYNMFPHPQLTGATSFAPMGGFTTSIGGTGNTGTGARGGSGGGSSIFGRGGNGGNAGELGENAPATSYGAGGGGSGGRVAPPLVAGGNGANGCLEVWY